MYDNFHFLINQVFPDHELAMVLIGTIKGNGSGVNTLILIVAIMIIVVIIIVTL